MDDRRNKQKIGSTSYFMEVVLLVLIFACSHGSPPPDANEAHYLVKAKHYWNPEFGSTDFFLSSADAHLIFYWAFGWLTVLFELPVVAWIGRLLSWLLIGSALASIGRRLVGKRLAGVLLGTVFVVLTEYGHLAGEWVIGGFEAKTISYGLAFWGIRMTLDGKWGYAWILTGCAAAFHVLAGGWIVFCLLIIRGLELSSQRKRPGQTEVCTLLLGGFLALGGLIPGILLSSSDPDTSAQANYLYVHIRLPHHLVITTFATQRIVAFSVLLCGLFMSWKFAARWRTDGSGTVMRLGLTSLLIAGIGILITFWLGDESPQQHQLLRFYFYRTSDVLIPLATGACVCTIIFGVASEKQLGMRLPGSALLLIGVYLGGGLTERYWDPRPRGDVLALPRSKKTDRQARKENTLRIYRHWQLACLWMKNNSPVDAIAITPLRQQTFKWYSERGEVVTRKDMPQDAASLLEWHARREAVYPFVDGMRGLSRVSNDLLAQNCERYDAEYLVLTQFSKESRQRFDNDSRFVKMFPPDGKFSYYGVFKFVGSR